MANALSLSFECKKQLFRARLSGNHIYTSFCFKISSIKKATVEHRDSYICLTTWTLHKNSLSFHSFNLFDSKIFLEAHSQHILNKEKTSKSSYDEHKELCSLMRGGKANLAFI